MSFNYSSLAKLNYLNSTDINDVKLLTYTTDRIAEQSDPQVYDFYSNADMLHAHEWTHGPIDYRINRYGFRAEDTVTDVDIAAFGCSFTFGLGLPADKLWHSFLAAKLGLNSFNFGIPGASVQTVCEIFLIVSTHINIKKAIFLLPSFARSQIVKYSDKTLYSVSLIPGHKSILAEHLGIESEIYYRGIPLEDVYKQAKNILCLVDHIAKERNIELYLSTWDFDSGQFLNQMTFNHAKLLPKWVTPPHGIDDFARDKMHPGIVHHQHWVDQIKSLII